MYKGRGLGSFYYTIYIKPKAAVKALRASSAAGLERIGGMRWQIVRESEKGVRSKRG